MIRELDFENQVLEWVDSVCSGQRIEDERVDAKAEWPTEHGRAARQLAGMANATQSGVVFLIIGLDEDGHSVVDPGEEDPDQWWRQVESVFDDATAPVLVWNRAVATSSGRVVALAFDVSRRPFVVKNYSGDGHIEREVPWRVATGTRSAHRHNLVRLLDPTHRPPMVTFLKGSSCRITWKPTDSRFEVGLRMTVVTKLVGGQSATLLTDGLSGSIELYEVADQAPFQSWPVSSWNFGGATGLIDPGVLVSSNGRYMNLDGTSVVRIDGHARSEVFEPAQSPLDVIPRTNEVGVHLHIAFATPDVAVDPENSPFRLVGEEPVEHGHSRDYLM